MTKDEMVGWHQPMDVSLSELQELVMTGQPGMLRFMGVVRWKVLSDFGGNDAKVETPVF